MGEDGAWEDRVKGMLKAELKRRNVTYAQLASKLADLGVVDTEPNIRNKLARQVYSGVPDPMPRRDWRYFLAAVGCLILAAAKPVYQHAARQAAETQNRKGIQSDGTPAPLNRAAQRFVAPPQAQTEDQNAKRSAEAAVSQARAAWSSVWISIAQTIIGGFGLLYVLRTYDQTRRTARAAIDGVSEARRAADAAHNALASQRAWLGFAIDETRISDSNWHGQALQNGFGFVINWKNKGQTPAFETRCFSNYALLEGDVHYPAMVTADERYEFPGVIPHGDEYFAGPFPLDDVTYPLFKKGKIRVILYSIMRYKDVFSPDVERVSELYLEAVHGGGEETRNGVVRDTITYKQVTGQNRMT